MCCKDKLAIDFPSKKLCDEVFRFELYSVYLNQHMAARDESHKYFRGLLQIDEIPGKVRQSAGNGKISCQNDEIICKARESVIVSGRDRAALIQEHAFKRTGAELHLEPFAFAEEQIIDVQAASVQRFKITLPFRQENIRAVQKLFRFRADSRKPGAAYVAPVSITFATAVIPVSSASSRVASLTVGNPLTRTVISRSGYCSFRILTASLSRTISPQLSVMYTSFFA